MENTERDYGQLIHRTGAAMLEKLTENDHKPSWKLMSLREMYEGLQAEYKELEQEFSGPWDIQKIRREAIDVVNFAAMIIDFCDDYEERKSHIRNMKPGFALNTGNTHGGGYGD